MTSLIKLTLKKGLSKCTKRQLGTLNGLGLRRLNQSKILKDTVPIRGMVMKMQHMLEVERFDGEDSERTSARLRTQQKAG